MAREVNGNKLAGIWILSERFDKLENEVIKKGWPSLGVYTKHLLQEDLFFEPDKVIAFDEFIKKHPELEIDQTQDEEVRKSDTLLNSKNKSDQLWEKIYQNPSDFIMLTGDRPTGRLHLGHLFGSLKNRVDLQNKGIDTKIVIADYQVITDKDMAKDVRDNTLNLVIDYLAAGIDPNKTLIFNHSQIPALNQLMIPFLSLVSNQELLRNPTVKAELTNSDRQDEKSFDALLFTYPVHQACDILFCDANIVPVGEDQLPHIELTNKIQSRFNHKYGEVFRHTNALLPKGEIIKVPGLDGQKMSKSLNNAIYLSNSDDETIKIIKKSPTDSIEELYFDPINRPGVSALLTYAALTSSKNETPEDIAKQFADATGRWAGGLKELVAENINSFLKEHRTKRKELEQDLGYVEKVLRAGNQKANEIANQKLSKTNQALGVFS